MTNIDELHLLLELIIKHNLPLSPILEYAIREKEEQYLMEGSDSHSVPVLDSVATCSKDNHDFDYYVNCFYNLSVGVAKGRKLPHKAILLLAVFNLIENGIISTNVIPIDAVLSKAFGEQWTRYFDDLKAPSAWIPFWYMKSEPFWHFRSNNCDSTLAALLSFAGHPSKGQMQPVIKCAYFDNALWSFLENDGCKEKFKEVLIETYIKPSMK